MDLNALTLLVEIIDAGNLSETARRLKMSRANVSYRLAQLERQVGLQLVRRTTRKLEPTEVGLQLYQHGLTIANELRAARETLASFGKELQGRIRLSVPTGFGQLVMQDWLIEFKCRYPGIVLDVMFENRVEDLLHSEIDIAIRVIAAPPDALVARELGPVRYVVCASRHYAAKHPLPTGLDQLRALPILTSGVTGRQLKLAAYLGQQRFEVTLEPTLLSEDFPFLRSAIVAGLGIGIVPDYVVADAISTGDVVTTMDKLRFSIFGTKMFMLYMPNRYQTRATRTFIEFILQLARARLSC